MKIELAKIVLDENIYPRSSVSPIVVERLMSAARTGAVMPPLTIESGTLRLVDGRHRHEMYTQLEIEMVEVTQKTYTSEGDLYADAVRLNIGHGQPLDSYTIKNAIIRLSDYGYSKEKISEVIRVPVEKIEKIERGFAVSQATGEPIALKGGLSHLKTQSLATAQVAVNRHYSGGKAVFHLNQVIELLKHDMFPRSTAFTQAMDDLFALWQEIKNKDDAA